METGRGLHATATEATPTGGPPRHVAVIGAGIVGAAAAIQLRRRGCAVTLIDSAGPAGGASFGNGGVLAACAVAPVTMPGLLGKAPRMLLDPDQPLFVKWRRLSRMAPWLARYLGHANARDARRAAAALRPIIGDSLADHRALAAGSKAERWLQASDYVFLYPDRAASRADAFVWALRAEHGFVPEALEGAALAAYDPALATGGGFALRLGGHGRIADPGAYVRALAEHAQALGARLRIACAEDVVRAHGAVTGVRLRARDGAAETLDCDAVAVTAGAWSGGLSAKLGLRVPLESERGYHIDLWGPSLTLRAPTMIAAAKCVLTPMEGRLRAAGIVEFGGLDAAPGRAPLALIRRAVARALPGLRWREATEWMGHRPAITDSLPLIGPVPGLRGAWLGFGHHHVGLTGGPRTGALLAQLICGARPNIDLAPYAPSRFE